MPCSLVDVCGRFGITYYRHAPGSTVSPDDKQAGRSLLLLVDICGRFGITYYRHAPGSTVSPDDKQAIRSLLFLEECRLLGCYAVWSLIRTDVSDERIASIIKVTRIGELQR
jgi:hypothetical protein